MESSTPTKSISNELATPYNQEQALKDAVATLEGIIQGCCHPDIAIRAVMVDLKPIRNVLKKIQPLLDKSTE